MPSQKSQKYPFRNANGQVKWVGFDQMMNARSGFLEIKGVTFQRAYDLEDLHVPKSDHVSMRTDVISDSLGFPASQLAEMWEHLQTYKVKGIEFKPDPQVPGFVQVHCNSEGAKMKYAATRGMSDQNSRNGSGAIIGAKQIEDAKAMVLR